MIAAAALTARGQPARNATSTIPRSFRIRLERSFCRSGWCNNESRRCWRHSPTAASQWKLFGLTLHLVHQSLAARVVAWAAWVAWVTVGRKAWMLTAEVVETPSVVVRDLGEMGDTAGQVLPSAVRVEGLLLRMAKQSGQILASRDSTRLRWLIPICQPYALPAL